MYACRQCRPLPFRELDLDDHPPAVEHQNLQLWMHDPNCLVPPALGRIPPDGHWQKIAASLVLLSVSSTISDLRQFTLSNSNQWDPLNFSREAGNAFLEIPGPCRCPSPGK